LHERAPNVTAKAISTIGYPNNVKKVNAPPEEALHIQEMAKPRDTKPKGPIPNPAGQMPSSQAYRSKQPAHPHSETDPA